MTRILYILLAAGAATSAFARDETGRLALIMSPNNAQPAVCQAGGTVRTALRQNAPLRIESESGTFELQFHSSTLIRGLHMIESKIPDSAPPGVYTLIAESPGGPDRVFRAVAVLPPQTDSYRIAHVRHLRAGDPERTDSRLFRLMSTVNAGEPDLVVLTGDLTADGTQRQFRVALDVLNTCRAPTFVAPGDADDREGLLETYLGALPAALSFGPDAYVLCPPPAAMTPGRQARLHTERRAVRAARWSVGAASAVGHEHLRSALTVFVDDPLDYWLDAADPDAGLSALDWGYTRRLTAGGGAQVQWYTASPRGLVPSEPASP